jgi:restriction system protein
VTRRRSREKNPADLLIGLIPPLFGLIFLAIWFVPGFKQAIGAFLYLLIWLGALTVVAAIGWVIWKIRRKRTSNAAQGTTPQFAPTQQLRVSSRAPVPTPSPDWSPELLCQLEWKRFEDVVAAYSRELGYEAKTTRIGADGGVDVQLFEVGHPHPVMIIQCKAWGAYKVGVKPVRELYGVMAADKVANGAFFTTGEFTSEAEHWARDKNLDLVNGREFLDRLRQLNPIVQQKLLAIATEGDYTTPTCPSCGVKMMLRTARNGPSEGNGFYGCRNYPRCRQTFKQPATT